MAVTMDDIKKLRAMTGAGMMDVKNTLTETDGDIERAATLLRERGIAKAAKKADREAREIASKLVETGPDRLAR